MRPFMPTFLINDIPVEFPHEAYPCQLTFMKHVLEALSRRQNALLESPTGTGKTLSLLCAAFAWRTANVARKQLKRHLDVKKEVRWWENNQDSANSNALRGPAAAEIKDSRVSRLATVLNNAVDAGGEFPTVEVKPARSGVGEVFGGGKDKLPVIVYASRTHSQLAQVIRELKRTSYRYIIN